MISASHNPYIDNGIKVIKSGYKMLDEEELNFETYIDDNEVLSSTKLGSIEITHDVEDIYINVYQDLNIPKTSMKITYDSANWANYLISKKVIGSFVLHTYQIGNTPDGLNTNLNVGSTHLDAIINAFKNNGSDIGLSFDGDGDRILVIDKDGITYDGDYIVYI